MKTIASRGILRYRYPLSLAFSLDRTKLYEHWGFTLIEFHCVRYRQNFGGWSFRTLSPRTYHRSLSMRRLHPKAAKRCDWETLFSVREVFALQSDLFDNDRS
jgi:hypothetical protein